MKMRKKDWEGRYVKIVREIQTNGGNIFPAGTVMKVTRNFGGISVGLHETDSCGVKVWHGGVSKLSERDVVLLSPDYKPEPYLRPINMLIFCPNCGKQHIDKQEPDICKCGYEKERHGPGLDATIDGCTGFEVAWNNPPHKSHKCHFCWKVWRPADIPTNGVATIKTVGKDDDWKPGDDTEIEL